MTARRPWISQEVNGFPTWQRHSPSISAGLADAKSFCQRLRGADRLPLLPDAGEEVVARPERQRDGDGEAGLEAVEEELTGHVEPVRQVRVAQRQAQSGECDGLDGGLDLPELVGGDHHPL